MGEATPETTRWRWTLWLAAAVFVGIVCRVAQWAAATPYWHDEAFLVLNLVDKDAAGLMRPLDAYPLAPQAAPPVFLLVERWIVDVWGESRLAMRALPLGSALVALGLFAVLARRLLPIGIAAYVTALFALSDRMIWHAAEVKQYSVDVLVGCALLLIALRRIPLADGGPAVPPRERTAHDAQGVGATRFAFAAVLASMLMWTSHATVFVFAGISLARAWEIMWGTAGREAPDGKRRALAGWTVLNLLPVVAFGLLYVLSIRVQHAPYLSEYWIENGNMMDWSRWLTLPVWMISNAVRVIDYPFKFASIALIPLFAVGAWGLVKHRRVGLLLVLIGPAALVMLAALLQKYPFGGKRLNLFLAPHVLLVVSIGLHALWHHPWRRSDLVRRIISVTCGLAILAPLVLAATHLVRPRLRDNKPVTLDDLRRADGAPLGD